MKALFAALRFCEDKNLADRLYWYLSEVPLSAGEKVLAPVGMHDKLQCAEVVRTVEAEEGEAPYDVRLIKRVAAKYGARKLVLGGREFLEFGGVKYDQKHYTRFGQVLLTGSAPPDREELLACGVTKVISDGDLEEVARTSGCVLLTGEAGRRAFEALLAFCRGGEIGIGGDTASLLREKLL